MKIVLLKDTDFAGVRRKAGDVVEAEDCDQDGNYAVMLGYGCWLRLKHGVDARPAGAGSLAQNVWVATYGQCQ
jgi:hypothetical protein